MIDENLVRKILISIVKTDEPNSWDIHFDFREHSLDSLDIVSLALKLEEASGVRIPDESIGELRSIHSVIVTLPLLMKGSLDD